MNRTQVLCAMVSLVLAVSACSDGSEQTASQTTAAAITLKSTSTVVAAATDVATPDTLEVSEPLDVASAENAEDADAVIALDDDSIMSGQASTDSPDTAQSTLAQSTTTESTATKSTEVEDRTTSTSATTESSTTETSAAGESTGGSSQPVSGSVAYKGVSAGQWSEIVAQRQQFGDPNDCRTKVGQIASAADVSVGTSDSAGLAKALASGAKVIQLSGGTYTITETIRLEGGRQLTGNNSTINAAGVDRGVYLDNDAILANVSIMNAENNGVMLNNDSLVYRVSAGRTGYSTRTNNNGAGIQVNRDGSNNCIVSVEAYDGYNEDGRTCESCFNGGNADGISIKFGANNNTVIDAHSYRNSDDGYDFWEGGTTFVYFGSAFDNGKTPNRPAGDGNGLKLGRGSATHYLYKTKAYTNRANGIDLNGNSNAAILIQTESVNNSGSDYVKVANQ